MPEARPKTTLTHRIVAKNIGQLVRVGRKKAGLSPNVLAAWLGLPLSYIEKIEKGQFRVSAEQWFSLCRLLRLDFEMLDRDFIDRALPATLKDCSEIGQFKIPKRYAHSQGSTVRVIAPLLKFVKQCLGDDKFLAYLRFKQIDPDYFHDYSHQLNVNFSLDVMRDLVRWGYLTEQNLDSLTRPVSQPATHGVLSADYQRAFGTESLLQGLIQHIHKYEINCDYRIEDSTGTHIDLSSQPNSHMKDFRYKDDEVLGNLPCLYKARYFKRVTAFDGRPESQLEELECHFHGAEKCVYRIAI